MIQKLGKYAIVEKLGEGAMGSVYKAYDQVLDRYVAIKTMAEDIKWDPELKLRFYREARSAASLHHPNIVTIHDLGEEGKITYIVMELLEGKDLKTIIRDRDPLPVEKKLSIMAQVADGLHHAHQRGIIHRDIKPSNIHVTTSGAAKILDFGIARIPTSDLTRSGVRLGTPVYMSPEQIRSDPTDARSDIFSAGIVFYELLTYTHPFRDKNIAKTVDNILFQARLPLSEQLPDAPPGLFPIVSTCLAKEPDKRYASMADFGRACLRLLDELNIGAQGMLKELNAAVSRLERAAGQPGAFPQLASLLGEGRKILGQEEKPDYLSLERLLTALSKEASALVQAGAMPTAEPPPIQPKPEAPPAPYQVTRTSPPPPPPAQPPMGADMFTPEPPQATVPPPLPEQPAPPPSPSEAAEIPATGTPIPSGEELRGRELHRAGEALLKEGRLEEAEEKLRQAIGILGSSEELVQMLTEARQKIESSKMARIDECYNQAREALSTRQPDKAIAALDELLTLDPSRRDAEEMRQQALAERDTEKAGRALIEEGEREKASGLRFLAERKFNESLRALARAGELLGEDATIQRAMTQAKEGIRAEELRARLQSELAESAQLLQSGALEQARLRVQHVLELSPESVEAGNLLARIEEAEQKRRRIEEISALVSQSQDALSRQNLTEAENRAREVLQLEPHNRQASDILSAIGQVRQKQTQDLIGSLTAKAQEAMNRGDYQAAIEHANAALRLDPKCKPAASLIKKAGKESIAREKELEKEKRRKERAAPKLKEEVAYDLEKTMVLAKPARRGIAKALVWVAAAVIGVAALSGGFYYYRHRMRPSPQPDVSGQIAAAKSNLDQKMFDRTIEILQQVLAVSPADTQAQALMAEAQKQKKQMTLDTLLLEAQTLRAQSQLEESAKVVQRILEIEPTDEPALAVRAQIEAEIAQTKGKADEDAQVQKWLASASTFIAAGKLAQAQVELDKAARLRPNAPGIPPLRKQLAAKAAETSHKEKEQVEAAKQTKIAELSRRADELFKQGKYGEAQIVIDQWLAEARQNAQAQALRNQIVEVLSSRRAYDTAMAEKSYDEALNAVSRLEKANPSDPSITELRRQTESHKASAKATLSILRLGEPGALTLDDQTVGSNGELEDKVIGIGKHKIAVRNSRGQQSSRTMDFTDGQSLTLVYDAAALDLRPMVPADRELMAKRKTKEQVHLYNVEHRHGLFGKCTGELRVSGLQVEYRASEKAHSWISAFSDLELTVKDDRLEFEVKSSKQSRSLRAGDASQAAALKQLWEKLKELSK